jgi:hypothetical protein
VIELDGPHSMVVAAGTEVVSFVLLGDQNAGKSTYLHSFGYNHDDNFLEMMSLLPVLSSSFINTRFLTKDDPRYVAPHHTASHRTAGSVTCLRTSGTVHCHGNSRTQCNWLDSWVWLTCSVVPLGCARSLELFSPGLFHVYYHVKTLR